MEFRNLTDRVLRLGFSKDKNTEEVAPGKGVVLNPEEGGTTKFFVFDHETLSWFGLLAVSKQPHFLKDESGNIEVFRKSLRLPNLLGSVKKTSWRSTLFILAIVILLIVVVYMLWR